MTQKHYDMLREAADLELQAAINQSYAGKMRETTTRSGGMLGHLANPNQYAAHVHGAETKRLRAAQLREQVQAELAQGGAL